MGVLSGIILVVVTLFVPPLGAFFVAGCGADLLINICLTLLGLLPGHIHAYYLEYVYYHRRRLARAGQLPPTRAPAVYSEKIQSGGMARY